MELCKLEEKALYLILHSDLGKIVFFSSAINDYDPIMSGFK
jgi:hypothetical protein